MGKGEGVVERTTTPHRGPFRQAEICSVVCELQLKHSAKQNPKNRHTFKKATQKDLPGKKCGLASEQAIYHAQQVMCLRVNVNNICMFHRDTINSDRSFFFMFLDHSIFITLSGSFANLTNFSAPL